jgi:hypothetical protein
MNKKRERESAHLFEDTSLSHLVSLFSAPPFSALLVGIGVTLQAPSSGSNNNTTNNNTNSNNTNKINSKTQSKKKSTAFNIKQQRVVFLELSCKERKNT